LQELHGADREKNRSEKADVTGRSDVVRDSERDTGDAQRQRRDTGNQEQPFRHGVTDCSDRERVSSRNRSRRKRVVQSQNDE
jgi:hypothetical protein